MRVEKSILLTFMGGGDIDTSPLEREKLLLIDRAWLIFLVLLWI